MSDAADPPRLSDEPQSDLLRRALDGARADVPQASTIEAMLARFPVGPMGGGSSGPADPSGPAAPSMPPAPLPVAGAASFGGGLAKIAGVVLLAGAIGVGAYLGRNAAPAPSATAPLPADSSQALGAEPGRAAVASPPLVDTASHPSATASTVPSTPSARPTPPPSASAETGGPTEIELLREAQSALASNPSHALELANQHQSRFPKGGLGQERDMIRIQALLAMGHKDEARVLADDFRRRHPDSAHTSRLDDLFPR